MTALPFLSGLMYSVIASVSLTLGIEPNAAYAAATRAYAVSDAVTNAANAAANSAIHTPYTSPNPNYATRNAASAVASAADAANAAWSFVRKDLEHLRAGIDLTSLRSHPDFPQEALEAWSATRRAFETDPFGTDWAFWIMWFERVLAGKDIHADRLVPIFNGITTREWLGDPDEVNGRFAEFLALYQAEDAQVSLAQSTPVEFSFDDLARVMRMIGVSSELRHLKEPSVVQSFLDDAEEVQDGLQDFVDDAKELQGGNYAGILRKRAERLLEEFSRVRDKTHLRAERIVMLAQELETYSKDEKASTDLGSTLYGVLEARLSGLKGLCRTHFGPAYLALAPLSQLTFEQVEQTEVVALMDRAIEWLSTISADEHVPLDNEGIVVFEDMQRELHDYRAAILEASTDEFRAILEERFAAHSGAMGLSLSRYYERSAAAAGNVGEHVDKVNKQYKRVKSLAGIMETLETILSGGPTS